MYTEFIGYFRSINVFGASYRNEEIQRVRGIKSTGMDNVLIEHLKGALAKSNVIAYVWNIERDELHWLGDLESFAGHSNESLPTNSQQFNLLLNPHDTPQRLADVQDFIALERKKLAVNEAPGEFSTSFKMRSGSGINIDIEETATIKVDEETGNLLLCGRLSKNMEQASPATVQPKEEPNVARMLVGGAHIHEGRRVMLHKVSEWQDEARQANSKMTGYLLTVGIDRMALFNEVVGALKADEILERTGERLLQIAGNSAEVVRVDGDVFAMLFRNGAHNEMAAVGQYILNNFSNMPLMIERGPVGVSVSVGGIALSLHSGKDPASYLAMAERALQLAKDKGGNSFESYDETNSLMGESRQLLKSAEVFMQAMKDNRLKLAFQPIMNGINQEVSFHESLIRLEDEKGKVLPAAEFIPAIERMGLSRLVDQFALQEAIQELMMFPDLHLSVNVSNLTLANQDWLRSLVYALRDRPSVAKRLIIEITESAVVNDIKKTMRIISTLQDLGCQVALDDFGAGYTAFSQLKNLNIDIVKIDKSFVRNIADDHNHLFVKTLRTLAEGVNVKTVGEGAETLAEAQILIDDGIDYIQGYVYGFPRTERVWLPENHMHRKIMSSSSRSTLQQSGITSSDMFGDHDVFRTKMN